MRENRYCPFGRKGCIKKDCGTLRYKDLVSLSGALILLKITLLLAHMIIPHPHQSELTGSHSDNICTGLIDVKKQNEKWRGIDGKKCEREKTKEKRRRGFIKARQGLQPHHCNKAFFVLLDSALLIHKMIWPSEFPVTPVLSVKCLPFIERILKPQLFSSVAK